MIIGVPREIKNNENRVALARKADLLIGAVLVAGAKAPKTVTEEMVKTMKTGAVIVDVAIDQGGSIATIDRVTTHDNPCYKKHGVIHYSVANMPGAVPRTSTQALINATLPCVLRIADNGLKKALSESLPLRAGMSIHEGQLTCEAVAQSFNMPWTAPESALDLSV